MIVPGVDVVNLGRERFASAHSAVLADRISPQDLAASAFPVGR
jgi:hypothetical protein